MQRAARYAALALTQEPPQPPDRAPLAALRGDVLIALEESLRLLTGIRTGPLDDYSPGEIAAHPVLALAHHVAVVRGTGPVEWEDRPAPTTRWSSPPPEPSQAGGALSTWKGLAVETVLARYDLEPAAPRLPADTRWRCIADVAALAEASAVLDSSLIDTWVAGPAARGAWRGSAAALEASAREVQAWAGHRDAPLLPAAAPRSIVTVNNLERLPLATDRLAQLLRSEASGPDLGLTSVLASTTTLASLSGAAADALDAAGSDPTVGVPDLLQQASRALRTHADALTEALREHRTRLGSTSTGSRATMAQARELASTALPRIRDLSTRPARALAASPVLISYGAAVAQATAAARAAVAELSSRGLLMVRADSETVAYRGWHETRHVGGHEPLVDALDRATAAARRCPPDPSRAAHPIAPTREPAASILGPELARQREQRRPAHPGSPISPAHVASR